MSDQIESNTIHITNCPVCDAFPVQFIARDSSMLYKFVGAKTTQVSTDQEIRLQHKIATLNQALFKAETERGVMFAAYDSLKQENTELVSKLAAQQLFIMSCSENPETGDQFFNSELRDVAEQKEALDTLLAKERERCATKCDSEKYVFAGSHFANILRSLK